MHKYYLYSEKATKTVAECTVSVFELQSVPIPSSVSITVGGVAYTKYMLRGNELHLIHSNPAEIAAFWATAYADVTVRPYIEDGFFGSPDLAVSIDYNYLTWSNGTDSFSSSNRVENLTVRDDEVERYHQLFRDTAYDGETFWTYNGTRLDAEHLEWGGRYAPVVITDDYVERSDRRALQNEFFVHPVSGRIHFYPEENLVRNPAFLLQNASTGAALEWTTTTGTLNVPDSISADIEELPVYGDRYIEIDPTEGIYQSVKLRSAGPHHISFYAALWDSAATSTGEVKLVVNPVDASGVYIDSAGDSQGVQYDNSVEVYSKTWTVGQLEQWEQFHAVVGADMNLFASEGHCFGDLHGNTVELEIRIVVPSDSGFVDGVQVHAGAVQQPFLGISGGSTVEYELAPAGVYTPPDSHDFSSSQGPDVNPLTGEMPKGYLVWQNVGGSTDFQLGKGGEEISVGAGHSQSVEGRYARPYAQVSGIGKLVQRYLGHKTGAYREDVFEETVSAQSATSVEPLIPENAYISGTDIHMVRKIADVSPISVVFYDKFENPVVGKTVNVSVTATSPIATAVTTDRAGRARYVHTAQATTGVAAETVTFTLDGQTQSFKVDVQ